MQESEFRAVLARRGVNKMTQVSTDTGIPYSSLLRKLNTDSFDKDDIKAIAETYKFSSEQVMTVFFPGIGVE